MDKEKKIAEAKKTLLKALKALKAAAKTKGYYNPGPFYLAIIEVFMELVCACTKTIKSPNISLGSRFWKGFDANEIGENNKLKELSDYKMEDLPDESSWKHQKLRNFIKTDKALKSLVGKKIEYLFRDGKNSNYAYCIVEL